eukprot:Transcript_31146.p2 GENE.Transcript_31146~~Transcript_31146.p2  ORF type:complete len:122 (+),score=23.86 Transcript_31146:53-367(+)
MTPPPTVTKVDAPSGSLAAGFASIQVQVPAPQPGGPVGPPTLWPADAAVQMPPPLPAAAPAPTPPAAEPPLPPGWEMFQDEEGNPYYHNQESGETAWEPPETRI